MKLKWNKQTKAETYKHMTITAYKKNWKERNRKITSNKYMSSDGSLLQRILKNQNVEN